MEYNKQMELGQTDEELIEVLNDFIASILYQRILPQSVSSPSTVQFMEVIGFSEIVVKFISLMFAIAVTFVMINSRKQIEKFGGTVYVPEPSGTRR